MRLSHFESSISPAILQRGLAYFQQGNVLDVNEGKNGRWYARVEGTEDYRVEITLDGDDVLHYDCDCPYDDLCKHVVAALYAIRQATIIEIPAKRGAKKAIPKTPKMSFEAILRKIDRKELEDFLLDYAAREPELRTHFLLAFADRFDDAEGKAKYLRHLDLALSFGDGRRGFFDYRAGREAMYKINEMLDKAENMIATRPQEAFFAASATLEKMAHIIDHLDDSHGEGSGAIYRAIELLAKIRHSKPPQALESELFDFAWSVVSGGMYAGWSDFEDELISMILDASHASERCEKALRLLDAKMKDAFQKKEEWSRDYLVENILRQKINFLKQLGRETEARELMLQNLHYDKLRREYVAELTAREDYAMAKAVIAEGIAVAEQKKHPGTVNQWRETLLDIARRENNIADVRTLTKWLYHNSHQSIEYYRQYKATFGEKEWPVERSAFLHEQEQLFDAQQKSKWGANFPQKLAGLYTEEGMWEPLFGLVRQFPTLHLLDIYEKRFAKTHSAEYLDLYAQAIEKQAEFAGDRSRYREVADYLKKIRQFEGGRETASRLAAIFRTKYAKRRAMIEELNGI